MEQRTQSVVKVFVGSPGDVRECREIAFASMGRLSDDLWRPEGLAVEGYGWDITHYPRLVTQPPQANIEAGLPRMADYDICLFIIGARLGTPLDEGHYPHLADGRQPTGTEYEYYAALDQCARAGRPKVLVYYKNTDFNIPSNLSMEEQAEAFQQFQGARAFVESISRNERGRYVGDVIRFQSDEQFHDRVEKDLKHLVRALLPAGEAKQSAPAAPPAKPETVPAAYLAWLKREVPDPKLLGLNPSRSHPVTLPDIYVPALVPQRAEAEEDGTLLGLPRRERHALLLASLDEDSLYVSG